MSDLRSDLGRENAAVDLDPSLEVVVAAGVAEVAGYGNHETPEDGPHSE